MPFTINTAKGYEYKIKITRPASAIYWCGVPEQKPVTSGTFVFVQCPVFTLSEVFASIMDPLYATPLRECNGSHIGTQSIPECKTRIPVSEASATLFAI